jgi:lipoyl(octanoyl) transferase
MSSVLMEFKVSTSLVEYEEALRFMDERVAGIRAGEVDECMWLLGHPSL